MTNKPVPLLYRRLLFLTLILSVIVMSAGAYTRLSHAGLGCPDWPGCYGRWVIPSDHASLQQQYPDQPFEPVKAWIEMGHRYLAATLGLAVLSLFAWSWRLRREFKVPLGSLGWLLGLVVAQGLFGRWTVTLKLWPQVVTLHLLGGLLIFALLLLTWLRCRPFTTAGHLPALRRRLPALSIAGGAVLLIQLFLGGWTSANYAAVACPDFPLCQQRLVPDMDWRKGFDFSQGVGPSYLGGQLDSSARTAIHVAHRLGAVAVVIALGALGVTLVRHGSPVLRRGGSWLLAGLALQCLLGVANVLLGFPLVIALAHHAGAIALWAAWLAVCFALWRGRRALA